MQCDLVLSGAGIKGIAQVSALSYLEKKGYTFRKICGTSAGALIGALVACNYTVDELNDIMFNLDYKQMMDCKSKLPFAKYINLFKHKGLYMGNWLENWIEGLLQAKGKTKFKDVLDENGESKLKIIVSDISKRKLIVIPDDLKENYNIDWKEFKISTAVRMSISIPFFFVPVTLRYKDNYGIDNVSTIVDGGCFDNFCSSIVSIFDVDGMPTIPTFGISLESKKDTIINNKTSLLTYAQDILDAMISKADDRFLSKEDKDSIRTINIETTGKVSSTNFNLSKMDCLYLYNAGIEATRIFLDSWDFQEYIKKYRS